MPRSWRALERLENGVEELFGRTEAAEEEIRALFVAEASAVITGAPALGRIEYIGRSDLWTNRTLPELEA